MEAESRRVDSVPLRGSVVAFTISWVDCGQVTIQVDDQPAYVQPRFDAYCTYHRLSCLTVGKAMGAGEHKITLTIHPEQPDKARILSQRNETMDDLKRFDGTAWYAGAILILGDFLD